MMNGPNAPHRPTLTYTIVIIIVVVIAYHLLLGRKR
jgi:hypothetical protein